MSEKYKVRDQDKLHFVTFATLQWVDVFTRSLYKDIFLDSLRHCHKEKGLETYAWVIMTNHVHLICRAIEGFLLQNIIRDLKKYTSVHICRAIAANQKESRKKWMLWLFERGAQRSKKHQKYCFWQNEYHPVELSSNEMIDQKVNYIHMNPVEAGWVCRSEDYLYSSAIDYAGGKGPLDIFYL